MPDSWSGLAVYSQLRRLIIGATYLCCLLVCRAFHAATLGKGRFCFLIGERIGHLVAEPDQFLRHRRMERHVGPFIFFVYRPCNPAFLALLRRHAPVIEFPSRLAFVQEALKRAAIRTNIIGWKRLKLNNHTIYQSPPVFSLSKNEILLGDSRMEELGITGDFVCFHNRDSAYLAQYGSFSYHDFRDCSISSFHAAFDEVERRGFTPVRVGAVTNQVLGPTKARTLDLTGIDAFTNLYLLFRCRFFVGNTSGLYHIANTFNIPVAWTNTIPFSLLPPTPRCLFIPKLIREKNGALVPFSRLRDMGLFDQEGGTAQWYEERDLEVVENTESEILDLVKDMLDLIDGKIDKYSIELQQTFKHTYYSSYEDTVNSGNISPRFLQRHSSLMC